MMECDMPFGARASMEPCGIALRYRDGRGEAGFAGGESFAPCENDDVALEASFDGEMLEVAVVPKRALSMNSLEVKLRHAFASDELVLLNGYQSWTDTVERPPFSRMRGLRGVPRGIVDRFSLDGGGDYGFVDYAATRGVQHGFSYATFRRGEGAVLVASLDEARGFTMIVADARRGSVTLVPECPMRSIAAGERFVAGRFAITRGTVDECYDRWFSLAQVKARPVRPLVGYTSWYRHYGDIDAAKLEGDLAGAAAFFAGEGLLDGAMAAGDGPVGGTTAGGAPAVGGPVGDGNAGDRLTGKRGKHARPAEREADGPLMLFQIDDGYCKVGDWLDVDKAAFPNGLEPLAAQIREAGFMPGLWLAPFVCERDSRLFVEHPEWLLRGSSGDPVSTGCQWSGGYALDTRNVEVRSYVLEVLQTMRREWGFGLFKVDFLYAACMMAHDGLNRGELMADAVGLLRTGLGEDALILGCGVPLASAFGVFDYCRIGCDVGLDWDDVPHMRLLHRERVSTKNSLANTYGRAPLNGRAFGNDPDVFFLRRDVRLSQAHRDELLFADADLGSVFLTSDDMGAWGEPERSRFRAALECVIRVRPQSHNLKDI